MTTAVRERVTWSRVAWFYGIAFGGAVLAGLALWAMGQAGWPVYLVQGGTALIYMPLPLVAGLIVERRAGRRPLIATEWHHLRTRFWVTVGPSAVYALVVMIAVLALGFVVALGANALGLPGAGHFVASDAEFRERLLQIVPALPADTQLPPVAVLAVALLSQGLLA